MDIEILLTVKFRRIPFSGFREVENVSVNQRPGSHLVFFSIGPKNTNLVEDIEIFSFQSSFVEFHQAVLEKSNVTQSIRGSGGHLVFPIGSKITNLVEDVDILFPVKFRWIPFSGFIEVKCPSQSEAGTAILFSDRLEKHKLGRGHWGLASCQVSSVSEENSKMSQPIWSWGRHLVFQWTLKHELGRGHWDLAYVKFRWILFSGLREVKSVPANLMPGQPFCSSDRPERHKTW